MEREGSEEGGGGRYRGGGGRRGGMRGSDDASRLLAAAPGTGSARRSNAGIGSQVRSTNTSLDPLPLFVSGSRLARGLH